MASVNLEDNWGRLLPSQIRNQLQHDSRLRRRSPTRQCCWFKDGGAVEPTLRRYRVKPWLLRQPKTTQNCRSVEARASALRYFMCCGRVGNSQLGPPPLATNITTTAARQAITKRKRPRMQCWRHRSPIGYRLPWLEELGDICLRHRIPFPCRVPCLVSHRQCRKQG
jgi:hypothetical protein